MTYAYDYTAFGCTIEFGYGKGIHLGGSRKLLGLFKCILSGRCVNHQQYFVGCIGLELLDNATDFREFIHEPYFVMKTSGRINNHHISIFNEFAQLMDAGTIVWNGPVGVFEFDQFGEGTKTLAMAIAHSKGFSIAGGGDTLAAIAKYGITDNVGYISTGGGAFLEFLEGKVLPAVEILEQRAH